MGGKGAKGMKDYFLFVLSLNSFVENKKKKKVKLWELNHHMVAPLCLCVSSQVALWPFSVFILFYSCMLRKSWVAI